MFRYILQIFTPFFTEIFEIARDQLTQRFVLVFNRVSCYNAILLVVM